MFDSDALPEPSGTASLLAPPIEFDPEYIALKARARKLQQDYLIVAYHNYKTLRDGSFGMGD